MGIGVEYGRVSNLRVQVPWTRLQTGEVQASTEDIELVLRLHIDHETLLKNPLLSKSYLEKMVYYIYTVLLKANCNLHHVIFLFLCVGTCCGERH